MCRKTLRTVLPLLILSLTVLFGVGSSVAEEAASVFELPPARGGVDLSGADLSGLDMALGLVGLPGTGGASAEGLSAYEQAWQRQSGLKTTYGERYRRNPDGSYGTQGSSQWNSGNIGEQLLEQALSAGSGYFSSWAEGFLGGYGKARISVRVNDDGDFTGSGDFLVPWYDSEFTTFFTQVGLRTMTGDRVIGNFGLGQRFFPSENFALGYNLFIDQDFSRNHTRGGIGVEAWYDWLRLAANYYNPISGWKGSRDYDHRLVEERPAEGFDLKLTGYLPFYRNLAVTGGVEKWKGDHVGSFGRDDVVQKDPKVWSYGLEWTPAPVVSASVQQRHSGGQRETQFGLTFNYHFDMPWEDQLTSATVAEMRTVDGSRHDFVSRQNEMILEYRAKNNAYRIEYLGRIRINEFRFHLVDGLGQSVSGRAVQVAAVGAAFTGGVLSAVFNTNGRGEFIMALDTVTSTPVTVTVTAGSNTQTFTLTQATLTGLSIATASPLPNATENVAYTQTLTAGGGTGPYTFAVTGGALPAGLTLTSGGAFSGAPTATGAFSFTVTVTDTGDSNKTASKTFSLTVDAAAATTPSITTVSLTNATQDAAYSETLAASGGTAPYTYAVTTGSLPTGLSLNPTTGEISGTPTGTGASDFTVTVTDSLSATDSKAFTLTVDAAAIPPSITTVSLTNATQNTAYSETLAASGGTAPYTYAVTTGSLPTGLSLNPTTGEISGTPTGTGASDFTVTVTDSLSATGTKDFTLTVDAAAPTGFIAVSTTTMNWSAAQTWCSDQGGRLPLINDSTSLDSAPSGTPIDGFGSVGASWPSDVPSHYYWTGTENSGSSGSMWVVDGIHTGTTVLVVTRETFMSCRAACLAP